jgi:hypothetical protein
MENETKPSYFIAQTISRELREAAGDKLIKVSDLLDIVDEYLTVYENNCRLYAAQREREIELFWQNTSANIAAERKSLFTIREQLQNAQDEVERKDKDANDNRTRAHALRGILEHVQSKVEEDT